MPADAVTPSDITGYARARDMLLERIVGVLQADGRVEAVWLSGSFGRGEADAWSDFDLHVAVDDRAFPSIINERQALYERVGTPLLVQPEKLSNAMPGGHFQLVIYPGPVEVDWDIGPLSMAVRPPASRLLLARVDIPVAVAPPLTVEERRAKARASLTFFWAMAPIAVKYAGRGATDRAVRQIELLNQTFIALWRLIALPDGPDPYAQGQNRALEPALTARLPHLGRNIDPLSTLNVIRGICREAELLHPALAALGVPIPCDMTEVTASLATIAEAAIREMEAAHPRN